MLHAVVSPRALGNSTKKRKSSMVVNHCRVRVREKRVSLISHVELFVVALAAEGVVPRTTYPDPLISYCTT